MVYAPFVKCCACQTSKAYLNEDLMMQNMPSDSGVAYGEPVIGKWGIPMSQTPPVSLAQTLAHEESIKRAIEAQENLANQHIAKNFNR
jgi:hypothetical protein